MKSMLADFEPQKETAQLVSSQRHFNVLLIISLPNMSLKKLPRQKRYLIIERTHLKKSGVDIKVLNPNHSDGDVDLDVAVDAGSDVGFVAQISVAAAAAVVDAFERSHYSELESVPHPWWQGTVLTTMSRYHTRAGYERCSPLRQTNNCCLPRHRQPRGPKKLDENSSARSRTQGS
jgi:hypothetical protein